MPRERIGRSMSRDKPRASPYPCSSSHGKRSSSKNPSESAENIKEWEEARCPVCIEHPHNAVLLHCSSHDKGCRPYICDTSYRHSNCLDQFRKAFSESPSAPTPHESSSYLSSNVTHTRSPGQNIVMHQEDEGHNLQPVPCEGEEKPKLSCPLCRGEIKGWIVVDPARQFLNAKTRSCSHESCAFSGTYAELRKHARVEHPSARPSEVDQKRQREWRRLERQRDLGDLLSTIQSAFGEEEESSSPFHVDEGSWLTVYFLIRIFQPTSRRSQRRRFLWGESHDSESRSAAAREEDNDDDGSEGVPPATWCHHEQGHQRTTPDDSEP
ncbi:uncharacterized protein LOC143847206 isoform X2 [Tasmannia lanceolata]